MDGKLRAAGKVDGEPQYHTQNGSGLDAVWMATHYCIRNHQIKLRNGGFLGSLFMVPLAGAITLIAMVAGCHQTCLRRSQSEIGHSPSDINSLTRPAVRTPWRMGNPCLSLPPTHGNIQAGIYRMSRLRFHCCQTSATHDWRRCKRRIENAAIPHNRAVPLA